MFGGVFCSDLFLLYGKAAIYYETRPVMKLLIGDARKTIESAISSMFANLPIGVRSSSRAITLLPAAASSSGVATYPGLMQLIQIPSRA